MKSRMQYYRWIKAESEIIRGLEQEHADDLAVHLYGTYRLKLFLDRERERNGKGDIGGKGKKMGDGGRSEDEKLDKGADEQVDKASATDLEIENKSRQGTEDRQRLAKKRKQKSFPSRRWSAWPLPPELVPSVYERFGMPGDDVDGLDAWTTRGPRAEGPRGVLAEVLAAVMLRKAKEQLRAEQQKQKKQQQQQQQVAVHGLHTQPRRNSRLTAKKRYPVTKLAMNADDEQSISILQPHIDSVLNNLDGLLLSLRESQRRQSKSLDQTRRSARNGSRHVSSSRKSDEKAKTRKGRPLVYEKPREGETYYMMRKRLSQSRERRSDGDDNDGGTGKSNDRYASKRKVKPSNLVSEPASDASLSFSSSSSAPPDSPRLEPDDDDDDDEEESEDEDNELRPQAKRRYKIRKMRDWTEVLEVARNSGWKKETVSRAAKRCAALFKDETT